MLCRLMVCVRLFVVEFSLKNTCMCLLDTAFRLKCHIEFHFKRLFSFFNNSTNYSNGIFSSFNCFMLLIWVKTAFTAHFFLGQTAFCLLFVKKKFHRLCDRSLKFMPYLLLVWHKATHRKKYQEFIVRSRFLIIRQK